MLLWTDEIIFRPFCFGATVIMAQELSQDSNFFSPSAELIVTGIDLPYDLYINSSALEGREKFVRITRVGNILERDDIQNFMRKYHQLYIKESDRGNYLKSLVKNEHASDEEKTEIIKESAIKYLDNLFNPQKEFSTEVLNETILGCKDAVESMVDVVQSKDIEGLKDLIGKLSFHDFYTYDHSVNVSMYCITIYQTMRPEATRTELMHAGLGGLLHDLGKIKIPTNVINNPGKLSDAQFKMIQKHPSYGKDLLASADCIPPEGVNLSIISRVVNEHHENVDGSGYPNKLEGDDIHLLAKVTAIADFFDAITTKRAYSSALTIDEALALMKKSVGKKIDAHIFSLFTKHMNKTISQKSYLELAEDFDPCQPREKLPVVRSEHLETKKKKEGFGTIIVKK